jgi:hypothetical protein
MKNRSSSIQKLCRVFTLGCLLALASKSAVAEEHGHEKTHPAKNDTNLEKTTSKVASNVAKEMTAAPEVVGATETAKEPVKETAKEMERTSSSSHSTEKMKSPESSAKAKAESKKVTKGEAEKPVCGVLESFSGDVQVLDPQRSRLYSLSLNTALPCGSWIATNQGGWAHVKHEMGPTILMGPDTLVQLLETPQEDHLTLYKGEVYAEVGGGMGEFRIISPTGRVRLDRARVIVAFTQDEDKTQLISIEDTATLENRFEPSRKIAIRAGEITELDFKLMRVMPLLPKPVSSASLHPMLVELRVSEREQTLAENAVNRARNRRLAGQPPVGDHLVRTKESYVRHVPDALDPELHSLWVRKLAGGDPRGEKILYPDKDFARTQKARVEVQDVETRFRKRGQKAEEVEKKKIIQELSQIRVE